MSASNIGYTGCLSAVLVTGVLWAAGAAAADNVDVATTVGSGALTTCRSWIVYNSCETHHVALPGRIAVGDKLKLIFGSNPKDYDFHVVQIRHQDTTCTLLSEESGGREDGEKLEVSPCQTEKTPKPVSNSK